MEEQKELAAFFKAHRGDADEWGAPDEAPDPRRPYGIGLTATVHVRFSPEDTAAMRRVAREKGMTYSDVVRHAVRAYTNPEANSLTQTFSISSSPLRSTASRLAVVNLHPPDRTETLLAESGTYPVAADRPRHRGEGVIHDEGSDSIEMG